MFKVATWLLDLTYLEMCAVLYSPEAVLECTIQITYWCYRGNYCIILQSAIYHVARDNYNIKFICFFQSKISLKTILFCSKITAAIQLHILEYKNTFLVRKWWGRSLCIILPFHARLLKMIVLMSKLTVLLAPELLLIFIRAFLW
jgi:hypothetical protein